ncbi:3' terminal RNA ribose 2'-O-methyltransferase Hen1 [Gordonia sp. Z-3]|uniref:3' terminal RNA ribose 2'-O-methyltransferase Hen1 n=1 Tax=Gordonia sp. Z-3 TaxID=3115408 RepID=UPI002E2A7A23|nr:3' terminal RNA ribose 2'-O-methyltransferase Hen1 [Gordonia sp. Z-3]MED5803035.1 3' terminal RNA ribose 2'-O-methyltransferase Hen1 [Gordonia sp. Z-3]
MSIEVAGTVQLPATDLGFLLYKHPDRVQRFATSQGGATVFFPVASPELCSVVLHVDGAGAKVDRAEGMGRYVNVVPFAASSRLVVVLGKVFGDALAGRCATRPELVDNRWPMTLTVPSVPTGGRCSPAELFEPLGWTVQTSAQPLEPPQWGDSEFVTISLSGVHTVRDALRHLSVCLPVLAGAKHYFVDDAEVDKLQRLGDGWLDTHPRRDDIAAGYVKHVRSLTDEAVMRLAGDVTTAQPADDANAVPERRASLARHRREWVVESLARAGARSVLDAGCGEGRLLAELVTALPGAQIAGVDVAPAMVDRARERLQRWRGTSVWQSSLMYTDPRCRGFDAVVLMEVIEHIEFDRLPTAMSSVFDEMAPRTVVITTPNHDHNEAYGLAGQWRHPDHRFEFTRADFAQWCASVAEEYRYRVTIDGVGEPVEGLGAPTQCAVFTRDDSSPQLNSSEGGRR